MASRSGGNKPSLTGRINKRMEDEAERVRRQQVAQTAYTEKELRTTNRIELAKRLALFVGLVIIFLFILYIMAFNQRAAGNMSNFQLTIDAVNATVTPFN